MAGRKVFTSGEILTAADVNSFLMDQSVMVFADSSARSSAIPTPSEGMVTYREDANRVEVYDGSAFGAIGGILQVVSTIKSDIFSTSSTSYTDITGLDATITPSASSSKVLVLTNVNLSNGGSAEVTAVRLLRDATEIGSGTGGSVRNGLYHWSSATNTILNGASSFLDSPATTSATTYKLQMQVSANVGYLNRQGAAASTGVSSGITLLEVAV